MVYVFGVADIPYFELSRLDAYLLPAEIFASVLCVDLEEQIGK
jgi:hypothetical protein